MPRYFFHVHNSIDAPDDEGRELPSREATREFAIEAARELIAGEVRHGSINFRHHIDITDGTARGWIASISAMR